MSEIISGRVAIGDNGLIAYLSYLLTTKGKDECATFGRFVSSGECRCEQLFGVTDGYVGDGVTYTGDCVRALVSVLSGVSVGVGDGDVRRCIGCTDTSESCGGAQVSAVAADSPGGDGESDGSGGRGASDDSGDVGAVRVSGDVRGERSECGRDGDGGSGADQVGAGGGGRDGSVLKEVRGVGPNYERNQAWKKKKRLAKERKSWQSQDWRSPASLESSGSSLGSQSTVGKCWTVKEESVAEKELREALERKKVLEAKLAARKAELALERMNDKTMTDLYNARVKQEGISLMNQATQRSEKSLEQLRSVSPGSSATPGEIREALLNSEAWKLKEKKIRAWIAAGRPEGGDLAILDEGKSTEVESLDTEDRALLAEYGTGSEADEDRYVEPSQAMKDETARVIRLSHKRHVEYVIRRLRGTGRDPASNLIGAELEYYQAMTAEEIANVE